MMKNFKTLFALSALAALLGASVAESQTQMPNIAGNYRCEGAGDACMWSGTTFTVTQNGNALDVKNDKGAVGAGHMTSASTISMGPPWNMFGVIHEASTIDWSNGSQWKKQ